MPVKIIWQREFITCLNYNRKIGIYVSHNGVPNINPLECKCFIDKFMNTIGRMLVIPLSRVNEIVQLSLSEENICSV